MVCAITTQDFSRQFAAHQVNVGPGSFIATWLTGATVMEFNPATMFFFCQTADGDDLKLLQPLTVAFQKVDRVRGPALVRSGKRHEQTGAV